MLNSWEALRCDLTTTKWEHRIAPWTFQRKSWRKARVALNNDRLRCGMLVYPTTYETVKWLQNSPLWFAYSRPCDRWNHRTCWSREVHQLDKGNLHPCTHCKFKFKWSKRWKFNNFSSQSSLHTCTIYVGISPYNVATDPGSLQIL